MNRWPVILAASCVSIASVVMAAASAIQPRTLAGTWAVQAEAVAGPTPNGGSANREAITGTLVIELKDSALTGTWTGPMGDAWPFTGQVTLDRFEFTTSVREIPVTIDGRQSTARFRWRFRGENDHDTLRGTMVLDREEKESDRLRPFTATRRK